MLQRIKLGIRSERNRTGYWVYRHGRPAYMKRRHYSAFQRWLEAIALGAGWAAIVVVCVRAV